MGAAASNCDIEIQKLFNVGSDNEFAIKLKQLLGSSFLPLYPHDVRTIIANQQEQFRKLFYMLIDHLQSNEPIVLQNTLRLITQFMPVLYEPQFDEFRQKLFWGTDSKVEVQVQNNRLTVIKVDEDVEPLDAEKLAHPSMTLLLDALMSLMFRRGFTIGVVPEGFNVENDPRLKGFLQELLANQVQLNLSLLWRGFATLAKYPNDHKCFRENRILVLSCLVVCMAQQLYGQEKRSEQIEYLVALEENHMEFFISLWGVVLFHKHGYFWFQDNMIYQQQHSRMLATLSGILLQLMVTHECLDNKMRKLMFESNIVEFSMPLLLENLSQSYIHDSKLLTTQAHNNLGVQEQLGLLTILLQNNKNGRQYIMDIPKDQLQILLNLLIYYVHQFFDDKCKFNVYLSSLNLLDYLLQFEHIGMFTQQPTNFSFPTKKIPITSGSYADCIIATYCHLLHRNYEYRVGYFVANYKKGGQSPSHVIPNYRCDLLTVTLVRLSLYVKNISTQAANTLASIVQKYYLYEFLLQYPPNAHELYDLTVVAINILHSTTNAKLLYHLILIGEPIIKFKIGTKRFRLFFKSIDDFQMVSLQPDYKALPELELTAEQEERFKKYLQSWGDIPSVLLNSDNIALLQKIVYTAAQLPYKTLRSYDDFLPIYNDHGWTFIPRILVNPKCRSEFKYDYYAYGCILQDLECLPLFNKDKCVYGQ